MRVPRSALVACVATLALTVAGPAAAQKATVTWNDAPWGSAPITIDQAVYPDAASVPKIVVRVTPKRPNREVRLEWYNRATKRWALEDRRKSKNGVARLTLNPICTTGDAEERYCNSVFSYRIVVRRTAKIRGVISKPVRVAFAPLPTR